MFILDNFKLGAIKCALSTEIGLHLHDGALLRLRLLLHEPTSTAKQSRINKIQSRITDQVRLAIDD